MEGSASGNVQEVPQMGAESKMEIEEPKVGEKFADYFTKEFKALGLSDAKWTDLGIWKLTEEGKSKPVAREFSEPVKYDTAAREELLKTLMDDVQEFEAEESDQKWVDKQKTAIGVK